MLTHTDASVHEISELGKKFKWEKPTHCPHCRKDALWAHGFVRAMLLEFPFGVWLKRYRCHKCSTIITMKPYGFGPYARQKRDEIVKTLKFRLDHLRWPHWCTRQRGGHWLRKFVLNVKYDYLHLEPDRTLSQWLSFLDSKKIPIF